MTVAADDPLARLVKDFVARETAVPFESISLETSLSWDLGLAGDDADDFFLAFAKEFDVDLESFKVLNLERHFGSEGLYPHQGCLIALMWLPGFFVGRASGLAEWASFLLGFVSLILGVWLLGRIQSRMHRHDPDAIRVRDLVEAAAAKKWLRAN